jgi:hypothetical protein
MLCAQEECQEKQLTFDFSPEMDDIRKSPIKAEHAILPAYGAASASPKTTSGFPIGTQKRFIEAAEAAARDGHPLNTLLTIRWQSLFSDNDVNPLRSMPTPERIDHLVELLRKWLTRHDLPPHYIWVREFSATVGEHWHFAFHLPKMLRPQIVDFVVKQTGEPARTGRRDAAQLTEGEFAFGEIGSWHLAEDTRPERRGFYLAAYLGKAEPSRRLFRGVMTDNRKKPVRGVAFGGTERNDIYDADQGFILGTVFRGDRFFIAKSLQQAAKRQLKAGHTVLDAVQRLPPARDRVKGAALSQVATSQQGQGLSRRNFPCGAGGSSPEPGRARSSPSARSISVSQSFRDRLDPAGSSHGHVSGPSD